jgi:hypothetical protein
MSENAVEEWRWRRRLSNAVEELPTESLKELEMWLDSRRSLVGEWVADANAGWLRRSFHSWELYIRDRPSVGMVDWEIEVGDQEPIAAGSFLRPVDFDTAKEMVVMMATQLLERYA